MMESENTAATHAFDALRYAAAVARVSSFLQAPTRDGSSIAECVKVCMSSCSILPAAAHPHAQV